MVIADLYTELELWRYLPYGVVACIIGLVVVYVRLNQLEALLNRIEWRLHELRRPPPPPPPD